MSELNKSSESLAVEVAQARHALRVALGGITINLQTAGSVRVQAWKNAHASARKVLDGDCMKPAVYTEARLALEKCATAEVDELAQLVFKG